MTLDLDAIEELAGRLRRGVPYWTPPGEHLDVPNVSLGDGLMNQAASDLLSLIAHIRELEGALEPFARVAQQIPAEKQDKDVTRVVMDEILSKEDFDRFAARGAPLRDRHTELILSLDGLRAMHFRRARTALQRKTS